MSKSNKKTSPSAIRRALARGATYVCKAGCGKPVANSGQACQDCQKKAQDAALRRAGKLRQ